MLTHDSVSLVICHILIRAQYGLISLLLQQFVTLHVVHYSGTHHPRKQYAATHVNTGRKSARVIQSQRASTRTLQWSPTTADTSANSTTLWNTKEKAWQHRQWQHATKVERIMQTKRSCTVFEIVSRKEWRKRSIWDQVNLSANSMCHVLSMRSDIRI